MRLGVALALALFVRPAAAMETLTNFELVTSGSEPKKSWVAVTNGSKADYPNGTSFPVEFDTMALTIQLGSSAIPFFVPTVNDFNAFVSFTTPDVIHGTMTSLGGGRYDVTFSSVEIAYTGSLGSGMITVDLTTEDVTLSPGNGCDLGSDVTLDGQAFDRNTGHMELVAGICPFNSNSTVPWRLFMRGDTPPMVPGFPVWAMLLGALLLIAGARFTLPPREQTA